MHSLKDCSSGVDVSVLYIFSVFSATTVIFTRLSSAHKTVDAVKAAVRTVIGHVCHRVN